MTSTDEPREKTFTAKEYNAVATKAQLISVSLMKGNFDIKPEFYNPATKKTLSYDTDVLASRFDVDEAAVSAFFRFAVESKVGRKIVLKCSADYFVSYDVPEGVSQDAAESFSEHVGLFAAYAYFRGWLSQTAWAANCRMPPLPTLSAAGGMPKGLVRQQALSDLADTE